MFYIEDKPTSPTTTTTTVVTDREEEEKHKDEGDYVSTAIWKSASEGKVR